MERARLTVMVNKPMLSACHPTPHVRELAESIEGMLKPLCVDPVVMIDADPDGESVRLNRSELMTVRLMALSMLDDDPNELVKRQMQPLLDKTAFLD